MPGQRGTYEAVLGVLTTSCSWQPSLRKCAKSADAAWPSRSCLPFTCSGCSFDIWLEIHLLLVMHGACPHGISHQHWLGSWNAQASLGWRDGPATRTFLSEHKSSAGLVNETGEATANFLRNAAQGKDDQKSRKSLDDIAARGLLRVSSLAAPDGQSARSVASLSTWSDIFAVDWPQQIACCVF